MKPLVSIIIPTWNRASLIGETLESAYQQSYPNIEVIVVDDGSTDGTAEVLALWKERGCVCIAHDRNQGPSAARNTGIRAASGQFIAFLDSDDRWDSDKIAKQVGKILESGDSTVLVYSGIRKVGTGGRYLGVKIPKKRGKLFRDLLRENCVGSTSSPLIRTEALRRVGGFDTELPYREDLDLWLRLSKVGDIDFVRDPVVIYRVHDERISSNRDAQIAGYRLLMRKYRRELSQHPTIAARYLVELGLIHRKKGDRKAAMRLVGRSILKFPTPKAFYYLIVWRLIEREVP